MKTFLDTQRQQESTKTDGRTVPRIWFSSCWRTFFLSSDWVKAILETLKRWVYFPVAALISVTSLKLSGGIGVRLVAIGAVLYGLFMAVDLLVQFSNVRRKVPDDSTQKSSSRTNVN